MEEIKKQIEEEADKFASKMFNKSNLKEEYVVSEYHLYSRVNEGFRNGYILCLSKWQDSERWRKVEEELPEYTGNPFIIRGYFEIEGRVSFETRYFTAYINHSFYKDFNQIMFDAPRHFVVKDWKPIH